MAPKNKKSAVKKKNEKKNRQKAALAAKEALQRKNASETAVNEAKKTTEKATASFSKEDKKKEKQRLKEKKEKEKREKWQIKRHAKIQKIKDKKKAAEAADKKKKTSPPAAKPEKDMKQKPVKEKKQEAQKAPNPEKKSEKSDAEKSDKNKLNTSRVFAGANEKTPPQPERIMKPGAAPPAAEVKTELSPVNEPAEKRVISNAGEIISAAEDPKAAQATEDAPAVEAAPLDEPAGDGFHAVPEKEDPSEECPEKIEEQPEEITVFQETVTEEIISIEEETIVLDGWQELAPVIDETDEPVGLAGDGYSAPVINEPTIESEPVIEEIFEYEEIQEEPERDGYSDPDIGEPTIESEPVIEEIFEYEEIQGKNEDDGFSAPIMGETDDESAEVKSDADITAENPTDETGDIHNETTEEPADDKQENSAWWTFTPIIEQEETIVADEPFETNDEINAEPVVEEFTAVEEETGKSAEEEPDIVEEQAEPDEIKAAVPAAPGIINTFEEKEKPQKVKRQKSEAGKKTFVFISGKLTEIKNKTEELPKRTKKMMLFAAVFIAVILVALITVSVINHTMPENSVPMYKGLTEESVNVRDINIELDEQLERSAATKVKGNTGAFKFFANNDLMINEWYDKIPLVLGNVESNKCDFLVTILDSSDTIVYRSMGIKPGYYLPSIRLFDIIPYGENDLTLVVAAYNPETYKNVGVQRMKLKLVIGFEQTTEQVAEQTTETETEFSTEPVTENSAEPSAELTAGFSTDFAAENPTG